MARRKIAFVCLLLFLFGLLLSPWASAPPPAVRAPSTPKGNAGGAQAVTPAAEKPPTVRLRVAAALDDVEFRFFVQQSAETASRFPDIKVTLERETPAQAYDSFRTKSRVGEAADVMLVNNEWVKNFAASGFLLPADGVLAGEALSEQFDALSASLKWNGYWWGVPRDLDPYVLVWNLTALHSLLGPTASIPEDLAQWTTLAGKTRQGGGGTSWLSIDGRDPFALLTWVESAAGQRTDTVWNEGSAWNGNPKGDALALIDREKLGVSIGDSAAAISALFLSGRTAAAVLPNSSAVRLTADGSGTAAIGIAIDRSAWKHVYVWPRGRSFVISSRTVAEDAARRWIAAMTATAVQQQNQRQTGKLPVYRSLNANGSPLAPLLSVSSSFPNQPSAEFGPELPARLNRLGSLWQEWSSGNLTMERWIRRWPEMSADFELND